MCAEYEYEPRGIFGTGHSSPLQSVAKRGHRPLGFLAARDDMGAKKKRTKQQAKAIEKHRAEKKGAKAQKRKGK